MKELNFGMASAITCPMCQRGQPCAENDKILKSREVQMNHRLNPWPERPEPDKPKRPYRKGSIQKEGSRK